ncbi:MAG: hypothetical protein HQK49_08760 [Oligoflexia bacterium]|nr:hypothetical protein [Oligoflexia bacterium]
MYTNIFVGINIFLSIVLISSTVNYLVARFLSKCELIFLPKFSYGALIYFLLFFVLRAKHMEVAVAITFFKYFSITLNFLYIIVSRKNLFKNFNLLLFSVTISIFIFFLSIGPFHEYPADPVQHLLTISKCFAAKTLDEIQISHFNYFLSLLMIGKIDFVSNYFCLKIYSALVQTCLFYLFYRFTFLLTKNIHLSFAGALLSLCYFGTNVFSFYQYYTFAKSFFAYFAYIECMIIFVELLRSKKFSYLLYMFPVLLVCLVGHLQEVLFIYVQLIFAPILYVFLSKNDSRDEKNFTYKILIFGLLNISLIFVMFRFFPQKFNGNLDMNFLFQLNKIFHFLPSYIAVTKFSFSSVFFKTVGIFGVLAILLAIIFFIFSIKKQRDSTYTIITAISLAPIIVLSCPLTVYVLCKMMSSYLLYRLLYGSFYWIAFPVLLFYFLNKITDQKILLFKKGSILSLFWAIIIITIAVSFYPSHPFWGKTYALIHKSQKENNGLVLTELIRFINSNPEIKNKKFLSDGYTEVYLSIHRVDVVMGERYYEHSLIMSDVFFKETFPTKNAIKIKKHAEHLKGNAIIVNRQHSKSEFGEISGHWRESDTNTASKYSDHFMSYIGNGKNFKKKFVVDNNRSIYIY